MEKFELLRDNPLLALTLRGIAAFVVAAEATILALYFAGATGIVPTLVAGLFTLLGPPYVAWQVRQSQEGTAELSTEGLTVLTRAVRHSYKWEHIATVEVITVGETSLWNRLGCQLLGIGLEHPVVRLRLRRWFRVGWVRSRVGTNVAGMPGPGVKIVILSLQDPHGFAGAVQRHLAPAPGER